MGSDSSPLLYLMTSENTSKMKLDGLIYIYLTACAMCTPITIHKVL